MRPGAGRPRSARASACAKIRSSGLRSVRYCSIACSTVCWVSGFFSSAVATGIAVDHQHQVERVRRVRLGVVQLADDAQPVGGVPLGELGGQLVGRLEERRPERDARILDDAAQHVDRAALVERVCEPLRRTSGARWSRRLES